MTVGLLMAVLVALVPLLGGAGLVAGGIATARRSRADNGRRVPVEAVVVDHTFLVQPARVTFDYPSPSGQPLRAERTVGMPVVRTDGLRVVPGDRLTVWFDPTNPHDVTLGPGSARSLGGYVMIGAGVLLALGGLLIALVPLLGAALRSAGGA